MTPSQNIRTNKREGGWLAVGGAGFVCAEGSAGIVDGGFGSFEQVAGDGGHGVIFGGVLLGFFHDFLLVDSADDVVAIDADVATLKDFSHGASFVVGPGGLKGGKGDGGAELGGCQIVRRSVRKI